MIAIGNIAQNGIRKTYRNQPTPGVRTPITVKRPMIPKMNAPSRMRSGQGMSGVLKCTRPALDDAPPSALGGIVPFPSSCADDRGDAVFDALVVVAALERAASSRRG